MAAVFPSSALRLFLLAAVFALGAYLQARGILPGIMRYWSDIVYLTPQHLELVAISGGIATAIGIPLGILLTRGPVRPYANAITQFVNLGTTIPTLAILALAMSVLGIGAPSAIFGLVVLTLLPIVLNTVAGLRMVPAHLIEAARGLCLRALWLADRGLSCTKESAMAKWWAPRLAVDTIHQCLLLHGQYGYRTELPVEQRLRDVLGLQIGDGTAQIMKLVIARQRLGRELAP